MGAMSGDDALMPAPREIAGKMPFRASPTKLTLFRQCRRRYRFEYVERLGRRYKRARPHLVMGAHVHETLRVLYTRVPPDRRSPEIAERILRRVWRTARVGFSSREQEAEFGQRALAMVRRFCALTDLRLDPLATERTHEAPLADAITLVGRVDRVHDDGKTLRVIDYKTGRRPGAGDDRSASALQAGAYAHLVESNWRRPVSRVEMFYLTDGVKEGVEINDATRHGTLEDVRARVAEIVREREFPPAPGPLCAHCDYLSLCDAGRAHLARRRGGLNPEPDPSAGARRGRPPPAGDGES